MTSHALARQQHTVVVDTLQPATAMDVLKQHDSPVLKYLVDREALIAPLLPDGIRFLSVVWDLVAALDKDAQQQHPALIKCTPSSVFIAIVRIQQWGLQIGRTAHLVPFKNQCTPIIDYKGEIQLATDAKVITHAKAVAVYANEPFEYVEGLEPILRHQPAVTPKQVAERGAMIGAFSVLTLPTREKIPHWMALKDIDTIRTTYSKQWKNGLCPDWYAKKTTIRQNLKTVPKSSRVDALLSRVERMEEGQLDRANDIESVMDAAPEFARTTDGEAYSLRTGEIVDPQPDAEATGTPKAAAPEHGSLEWAQQLPLPLSRSEFYGQPLGTLDPAFLAQLPAWCEGKMNAAAAEHREVSPAITDLYTAVNLLLERPTEATAIDDDDVPGALPIDDAPKGAPPGSKSVRMPKPGTVQDAFPLGDQPKAPNRNAIAEP